MAITKFLQTAQTLEIQAYRKPAEYPSMKKTHVPFSGAPYKHPCDPDKIILVADPFSTNSFYYEFIADDIGFAEELPHRVTLSNETVVMARIWVKKKSVAVRCDPFVVDEIRIV